MCQMKMIQDWGYDYIYLHQPSATTHISLKDHLYKDVDYTPISDMVFVIEKTNSLPSLLVHKEPIWLCEGKEEPDNSKEEPQGDNLIEIQYIMCKHVLKFKTLCNFFDKFKHTLM